MRFNPKTGKVVIKTTEGADKDPFTDDETYREGKVAGMLESLQRKVDETIVKSMGVPPALLGPLTEQETARRKLEESSRNYQKQVKQSQRRVLCGTVSNPKVFTFGKYKDWPIEEVPKEYLEWCHNEFESGHPMYDAIEEELRRR